MSMIISPHMLAAPAGGGGVPAAGAYWDGEGGYYAGLITYSDSRSFHLVVASKDADVSAKPWGMTAFNGPAIGATSQFDGVFNTAAAVTSGLDVGTYPKEAFKHCENYVEGGKTDFYMAAQVEMVFIRDALRPTKPGQVAAFATGGAQAFDNANRYWTSTETGATTALSIRFDDANLFDFGKNDTSFRIRPVRRVAV